jgi:hypothetical protein
MAFLRMRGVGATGGRAKLGPAMADVKIEPADRTGRSGAGFTAWV